MLYMTKALDEAKKAYCENEVPVGAVIVQNGKIIASSHNTTEQEKDATCHAEMNVIKSACRALGSKYLDDCDMYVTLEPCPMCAGAIINSKIKRVYIGAPEPKSGCCGSVFNLLESKMFNHNPEIYHGMSEDECKALMKEFFAQKRHP